MKFPNPVLFILSLGSLSFLTGSAALACIPTYTTSTTYSVLVPGVRVIPIQIGGFNHNRALVSLSVKTSHLDRSQLKFNSDQFRVSKLAKSSRPGSYDVIFEVLRSGQGTISIDYINPAVAGHATLRQEVDVTELPSPKGC